MKTKILSGTILALAFSALHFASGQEEFSFKLYMESLANGKKDTLELGFSPNGYESYDYGYDSTCETPAIDFRADTLHHTGAFIIPGVEHFGLCKPTDAVCFKGRTAAWNADLCIILPEKALPVQLTWDSALFKNQWIMLSERSMGCWPDYFPFPALTELWMQESGSCLLESKWDILDEAEREQFYLFFPTDAYYHEYHPDSAGMFDIYQKFYIWGRNTVGIESQTNQGKMALTILQNPVQDILAWKNPSDILDWKIFDLSGRLIRQGNDSQNRVDCHDWPAGLYFLSWKDIQGNHGIQKIIKR